MPNGPTEDLFARLDDTRFNLILIGQRLPPDGLFDHNNLILVLGVPDVVVNDRELRRARIPKPSFYLLRPDGHVGLAGVRLEAAVLTRYLAERFEFRMASTH